jgi:uncharacterized protein
MTLRELRDRLRPPFPVMDVHVHPLAGLSPSSTGSAADDARTIREAAERAGVTKMCLFSVHPACPHEPTVGQCREANESALSLRDAAPDLFLPFCYVNPMYPEEAVAEIDRRVREDRMCGVKLWVARRGTDPGLDPILARAAELGVPVLQHAWDKTTGNLSGECFPRDVADMARRHPRTRIVMAHLNGCGLRGIAHVADHPNVVVDTGGGDPESGMVEAAVAALGPKRVVYASDLPVRHLGACLGKVLGADLTDETRRDILWNNAARLMPSWAGVKPMEGGAA